MGNITLKKILIFVLLIKTLEFFRNSSYTDFKFEDYMLGYYLLTFLTLSSTVIALLKLNRYTKNILVFAYFCNLIQLTNELSNSTNGVIEMLGLKSFTSYILELLFFAFLYSFTIYLIKDPQKTHKFSKTVDTL